MGYSTRATTRVAMKRAVRTGVPVLVKESYFPNWQASGASGVYRVAPNLMVVVPTAHNVVLHYGASPADRVGEVLSVVGLLGLLAVVAGPRLLRRGRHRKARGKTATAPAP